MSFGMLLYEFDAKYTMWEQAQIFTKAYHAVWLSNINLQYEMNAQVLISKTYNYSIEVRIIGYKKKKKKHQL